MKKRLLAALTLLCVVFSMAAYAEDEEDTQLTVTTKYRAFMSRYRNRRERKVSYYDDVYAVNHGKYGLQPFDSQVPEEFFIKDEQGVLALAPSVLDITNAMRVALYGGDYGDVEMFYGQYCEEVYDRYGRKGFTGVHEGIDFVYEKDAELHAIMDGVVTRAGDSNGTVGIYNEEFDVTVLYLHCRKIEVRRGDVVKAGDFIALEGKKGSSGYYTHVEMRNGRRTSSNPYRNCILESDCPYEVMQRALNVEVSGRLPQTYAAQRKADLMRRDAELAAIAAAHQTEPQMKKTEELPQDQQINLIDILPGASTGYGFEEQSAEATPAETTAEVTPEPTVVPEATLPPVAQ